MLYIASDHRGFKLKETLKKWLDRNGYAFKDLGNHIYDKNDDYPDFAKLVAEKISQDPADRGVVICGSGAGVDVTANKFAGVRSAVIGSSRQAEAARRDDDINVLALAADFLTKSEAIDILSSFLATEFSGKDRHKRRLEKITEIEKRRGLQ